MNHRAATRPDSAMAARVAVKERILAALESLGPEGELITLTELRKAVPAFSRETFDKCLLELERSRELSLRVAQSPMMLTPEQRLDGISLENRGLIYYAMSKE